MPRVKMKRRRYYLYQMRGNFAMGRVIRRPPPPPPDPEPVPEPTPEKLTRPMEQTKLQRAVIFRRYKGRRVLRRNRWHLDPGELTTAED